MEDLTTSHLFHCHFTSPFITIVTNSKCSLHNPSQITIISDVIVPFSIIINIACIAWQLDWYKMGREETIFNFTLQPKVYFGNKISESPCGHVYHHEHFNGLTIK